MSWSRWVSCLTASAAIGGGACARAPEFQVLSESTRLSREQSPPADSAVFDGRRVRLRGARGETLGVELRVSDGRARSVRLTFPEAATHVTAFEVRSLEVREPSSGMYGPSTGKGTYPDVLLPAEGALRTSDVAYFDVEIASTAEPGRYEGELTVDARAIPAEVEVSRARIQLDQHPLVWVFYAPREIARVHGLPDRDDPALIAKEAEYDALFRAHGAYLASDVSPARFAARRRFVHDVSYWPVAIDTTSDAAIASDVRSWLALFRGSGVTPFAIPVDEPHSVEERERARHIGEAIGLAGGGRPGLLRAVTDEARPGYGDAIDVFVSPRNIPAARLDGARRGQRFWTYNGRPPEAGSMILDTEGAALRTWGWIAARYDVELWYAWEGLYFSDRYNRGGPTDVLRQPVTFDERRRGGSDWGNGDGVLAYPGPLASLRLKVLRRGLQDRLLLRELERCGGADTAREIERRTVPVALGESRGHAEWPASESAWERARGAVLDAIEARCP
jgi:hypothetical protein